MAGEYRSGQRVRAGSPTHFRASAGDECFVVVLSSWSYREEDDCFERRVHFRRFDEALLVAQRHSKEERSGEAHRSARVWYGERLMLWDSQELQYDSYKYTGPRAIGLYRVVISDSTQALRYELARPLSEEGSGEVSRVRASVAQEVAELVGA